jgi:hypothetical protein
MIGSSMQYIYIYQLITFDSLFFSKYSTAKIKIWQHYLLTQGIRPDDKMTVIHLIHITCWPYHFKVFDAGLHDQIVASKRLSKFSFAKFFDRVNLHQKLCQRTPIDIDRFDGIEIPSYCSEQLLSLSDASVCDLVNTFMSVRIFI